MWVETTSSYAAWGSLTALCEMQKNVLSVMEEITFLNKITPGLKKKNRIYA